MLKYIRILSDLHLDFDVPDNLNNFIPKMLWSPPPMDGDKQTVLILAGDIWHAKKTYDFLGYSWIKSMSEQFFAVVIVLGNHDLWDGNISKEYINFENAIKEQKLRNVFILQNRTIKFGKIKFVGGTLWTDYNKEDESSLMYAKFGFMKDYNFIKSGVLNSKLNPRTVLNEHYKTLQFIHENSFREYPKQRVWVITHHPPSMLSLAKNLHYAQMKDERSFYCSDLDDFILQHPEISFWVHGHSHLAQNYQIGECNVIVNPRGYPNENTNFNPWLRFSVSGEQVD